MSARQFARSRSECLGTGRQGKRRPQTSTIIAALKRFSRLVLLLKILALPDNGLLHYGKFHLNPAAALEDAIIREIDPEWNGGTAESEVGLPELTATELEASTPIVGTFSFTLQPTYYRTGFFNVGVSSEKFLAQMVKRLSCSLEMKFSQSSVQSVAALI